MSSLLDFHFMRPLWLLALLPCVLLLVGLWRHYQPRGNWQRVIDHELLLALSADTFSHASRAPLLLLALAWLLAVLALAGPSWQKLPQPVYQKQDALVILLDLSPSMYATDITPSRLVQAQREIRDILKLRQEGLTALIAYAGDAHVVTPLTDDTDTIELLLPSLAPAMMPRIGNQPVAALQLASELAANNPSQWVRVLFITDEIPAADFDTLEKLATEHEFELSILAIGSDAGAPIPLTRGGFLNNSRGEVVMARLNDAELAAWAQSIGARYQRSSYSDRDIEQLLQVRPGDRGFGDTATSHGGQQYDSWLDAGPWLALAMLPLALLAFRRGWLLGLFASSLMLPATDSYALSWRDLWQTDDQQAQALLEQGQAERAAETFEDTQWQGVARYRAGEYDAAAEAFATQDSSRAHYNRGNALARAGQLQAALGAYERALELDPDNSDALSNKQQVEKALQQQQKKQQQQQQQQSDQPSDQNQGAEGDNAQDGSSGEAQSEAGTDDQQQDAATGADAGESGQPNATGDAAEPPPAPASESDAAEPGQDAAVDAGQHQGTGEQQQAADGAAADAEATANSQQQSQQEERLQQWLRQIPDEPGDLLQRKFNYQYRQQSKRGDDTSTQERY